jgi:hypothetical protein
MRTRAGATTLDGSIRVPDSTAMPRRLLPGAAALVAALVGVLAVRIYAAGYGADNDTWLMLGTWDVLVDEHRYVPSRPPGYVLAEVAIGALADVGGHWLSNLASLVLGGATLVLLHRLLARRTEDPWTAGVLVAVLAATPAFVIAATTSMDYVYGLSLFVAGWWLAESRRPLVVGALLLGLATAARLAYGPLALVVVLVGPGRTRPLRQRLAAVAVSGTVAALAYVPPWRFAGDLSFITAERPTGQGVVGLLGRAVLKGTDLLGLVGTVVAMVLLVLVVRHGRAGGRPVIGEWWLLVVVGVQLVVWLWIPAEPSYLLPGLVALLAWVARPDMGASAGRAACVLVGALALYALVDVRIVDVDHVNRYGYDTCDATEATGARLRPHVTVGPLLGQPETSDRLAACNTQQRAGQAQRHPS